MSYDNGSAILYPPTCATASVFPFVYYISHDLSIKHDLTLHLAGHLAQKNCCMRSLHALGIYILFIPCTSTCLTSLNSHKVPISSF